MLVSVYVCLLGFFVCASMNRWLCDCLFAMLCFCVCMIVCLYVPMRVCLNFSMLVYVCVSVGIFWVNVCRCVRLYVCVLTGHHDCMFVFCMCVGPYRCMYVGLCVCIRACS